MTYQPPPQTDRPAVGGSEYDDDIIHARAVAMVEGSIDSWQDCLVLLRVSAILKACTALEQEDPLASAEVLLAEHSQITMSMTRDALAIRDRKN